MMTQNRQLLSGAIAMLLLTLLSACGERLLKDLTDLDSSDVSSVSLDGTPPTLAEFAIPGASTSLTVSGITLAASDDIGVAGYFVSEDPAAPAVGANGWSSFSPKVHVFSSAGTKTLYAWVKDAAGNISSRASANTTITLSDSVPPSITAFAVSSLTSASDPFTATISTLTATDNIAVAGYLVTESSTPPSVNQAGWRATPADKYKFSTAGSKTLHAWVKDAAGNLSSSVSAVTSVNLPGGSPVIHLTQCGDLTTANANYILDNDVRSDGTCFYLKAKNISLDLNGHTITYADMDFPGFLNPGFEEAQGQDAAVPAGWDLSGAHGHAYRRRYTDQLFFDQHSLLIENLPGDAYPLETVLSSPVTIQRPGRYAITAEVRGGPYNVINSYLEVHGLSTTCSNSVSSMHLQYGGDMLWGLICEFNVTSVPVTVRGKIVVGTKDETKKTSLSVDEMDIRPIDDALSGAGAWGMAAVRPFSWNIVTREIKNGTMIEGRSKAIYSSAISRTSPMSIHDLRIVTNGINSSPISETNAGNLEIRDNHLEANGKVPLNRQYPFAVLDLGRTAGGNRIINNVLLNGPHVGINHGDAVGDVLNPVRSEISGNTIKLKVNSTNGFSLNLGSNIDVHDNLIQPVQGHGIGIGRGSDNVRIYNNLIEPRTWPCSEYSSYFYPNSAHGIRMKNYGAGVIENVEIFNNTIIGKTTPQLPNCYTEVSGLTNYIADDSGGGISKNFKIHDNVISVETDNYLQQHAIAYTGQGQGEFYRNTLTSNHIIVEWSNSDGGGVLKPYKTFDSNTLIKAGNAVAKFYTFRYGYMKVYDNFLTNTILQGGADLKDISFGHNNDGGANYSVPSRLKVGWDLVVSVEDADGPVAGASVQIADKDGVAVHDLSTNGEGKAVGVLTEYTFTYSKPTASSIETDSPYFVQVSMPGYGTVSQAVSLSQRMTLKVNLSSGTAELSGTDQ